MKTAIVSGATGWIGSAVARHLSSKGVKTICLGTRSLTPTQIILKLGANAHYLRLPLEDLDFLPERVSEKNYSVEDCIFYHFAWSGEKTLTGGSLESQLKNVHLSGQAIEIAKKLGCKKFINCGSMQETVLEENLNCVNAAQNLNQFNYSVAKLAARDLSRIVAYVQKIDYIHTRLSSPVSLDLTRDGYIESTLRNIREGRGFQTPKNSSVADLISLEEVAEAYYLLGLYGKNTIDYYIGTKLPATLVEYFRCYELYLETGKLYEFNALSEKDLQRFDTKKLQADTPYMPSESFLKLMKGF